MQWFVKKFRFCSFVANLRLRYLFVKNITLGIFLSTFLRLRTPRHICGMRHSCKLRYPALCCNPSLQMSVIMVEVEVSNMWYDKTTIWDNMWLIVQCDNVWPIVHFDNLWPIWICKLDFETLLQEDNRTGRHQGDQSLSDKLCFF